MVAEAVAAVVVALVAIQKIPRCEPLGGGVRVWDQYNVHLLIISLHYGENSWSFLAGTVLTTLHGHAIFKNCHLCGVCWEDCECRKSHVPTPPGVAITISRLIKVDRRG